MTYSLDLRQRVVDYVEQGHSVLEAVTVFQVSKATIHRWRHRSSLAPTVVKTRRRKLDQAALQQHVRDYPEAGLIDRAREFEVDPSAISDAFKRWGITVKMKKILAYAPTGTTLDEVVANYRCNTA